jgi:endonuclease III
MIYRSTRSAAKASPAEAILAGIAPDGGLYLPAEFSFPGFSSEETVQKDFYGIATDVLFALFPEFTRDEVEEIVRPCGLYHTKAQNIIDASRMLITDFGGKMPQDMDALLQFPGVGRKIANLLLGDIYKKPAIVADTHCIRICGRFGIYPETLKDPHRVEKTLVPLIAPEKQSDFCHRIVDFGRDTCDARSPKCEGCVMQDICAYFNKK